jgi:5S rRNA maturation endonuclease (ribonuclease M5)
LAKTVRRGFKPKKAEWKHYYELEAQLKEIINDINYYVSAIIVEGKKDEDAMRVAGIKSPVIQFSSSGLPVFAFVEEVVGAYRGKTVLVMLDFDKEGNEMTERISQELEEKGVRVQRTFRRVMVRMLIREGILHIEEIGMLKKRASV